MNGIIGVPHTATVPWEFHSAYTKMVIPEGVKLTEAELFQSVIHESRELVCGVAVDKGFDFVFMLDSDMVPEPSTLCKLLKHGLPIVSAPCFKRCPPYEPCFYEKCATENGRVTLEHFKNWPAVPFQAQGVGAACLLIMTEALKMIPRPWFQPLPGAGEDISFCLRANKADIPIFIDPLVRCGHLEARTIYEEHYRGWAK